MDSGSQGMHSEDGHWWWTGNRWVPAWSADHRAWFDGTAWVPVGHAPKVRRPVNLFRAVVVTWLVVWLVALATAWPSLGAPPEPGALGFLEQLASVLFDAAAVLVLLIGPASGFLVARRGGRRQVWRLTALVCFLLWSWLAAGLLMTPPVKGPWVTIGLVLNLLGLWIPALLCAVILVGAGACLAVLVARSDRRRPGAGWWWTGGRWVPDTSPDGRSWFDGNEWRPHSRKEPVLRGRALPPFTRGVAVFVGLWLLLWVADLGGGLLTSSRFDPGDHRDGVFAGVVIVTGLAILVSAFVAHRHGGRPRVVALVAFVWLLLILWYVVGALVSPDPDAAGNAVVNWLRVLYQGAGPTLPFTALMASLGGGLSALLLRRLPRPSEA